MRVPYANINDYFTWTDFLFAVMNNYKLPLTYYFIYENEWANNLMCFWIWLRISSQYSLENLIIKCNQNVRQKKLSNSRKEKECIEWRFDISIEITVKSNLFSILMIEYSVYWVEKKIEISQWGFIHNVPIV